MPITNLGRLHLTTAQMSAIDTALSSIEGVLVSITTNLSSEERSKYGSVNETNKLLINKVREYRQSLPQLSSSDVDWAEFELDFQDRQFSDTRLDRLETIKRMLSDFKIVHDFDNYQDSLTDYAYSQYKEATKTPAYTEKVSELKQFFPNQGNS